MTQHRPEQCLDEVELAAHAEGKLDQHEQEAVVAHLASCAACRSQFAALMTLVSDPAIALEMRRVRPAPRRALRWGAFAGASVLAAASIAVLLLLPRGTDITDAHRDPTITAADAPQPMFPVGDVAAVHTLAWALVSGADQYRVTVFDAAGKVVFETETTDTAATLPSSMSFSEDHSYLWKVEARTDIGRWTSSALVEFRVAAKPQSGAPAKDSLRLLARAAPWSVLVRATRARPLEVRDAIAAQLRTAVRSPPAQRAIEINVAKRIAAAYSAAWRDSFLVNDVAKVATWTPARLATRVWADSVRRAGVIVYSRDGPSAAIAIWRRAHEPLAAISDTAGMAAVAGNIGAAFAREGELDSASLHLERARTLAASIGDLRVQANAIAELAGIFEQSDQAERARAYYAQAIGFRQRIGDSRGLAADYNNLAGLAQTGGDLALARKHLEAALAINIADNRAEVAATNLVNLAGIAGMTGDFTRGVVFYKRALATWRENEQWSDVADALRGLANLELRRGNYSLATNSLIQALHLYNRTGPAADAIAVRQELAAARAAQGDLQGAIDELRIAQSLAESATVGDDVKAGLALTRADLARQLNSPSDAERMYVLAQTLYRRARDRDGEAEAQQGRAMLLLDQNKAARAQDMLQAALRTQEASGNERAAALTRITLGDVALQRGDTAGARRELKKAAVALHRLGDPVAAAAATGAQADLELAAGAPSAAEALYRSALANMNGRSAPSVTWQLHAGLARVRRARGATDEAIRKLRLAISDIERISKSLALPERRSAFHTDKWDVYVELAALEQSRGRTAAAFAVSEQLRSGEMREIVARGRMTNALSVQSELLTREQDLRHRLAELNRGGDPVALAGRILRGPDVPHAGPVAREALLQAERSYAELMVEMRERATPRGAFTVAAPPPWRRIADKLARNEALVEYLLSDDASFAFIVTRDTIATVRLSADRRELARLIEFVRGTLEPRGSPRLDSLWRAPLSQLYSVLIGPIEASGILAGKNRLTIVPHAELHYLPFAALITNERRPRFLVERFHIGTTPSAAVWLALSERKRQGSGHGVVAFAPHPSTLPASQREVAAIRRVRPGATRVFVGAAATENEFRRTAPAANVVHLATYGVLNKQNPLFSFVAFARNDTHDGRLEAHEVFAMNLSADLIVLSACQTGLASGALTDVPAGDDWVGLARAFLAAGSKNVIASLWPVQDQATATLMQRFYESYSRNADPARALANAQRSLLSNSATSHPYYWAGFEVVGGR